MYVGQYQPVQIPKCGKLHIQKNGYVYLSNASVWNNEKKRSIDNRVSIGKVIPDLPGMMYPNKKYFDIFGDDSNSRENTMTGNMITNLNIENFRGIQKLLIHDTLLQVQKNKNAASLPRPFFPLPDRPTNTAGLPAHAFTAETACVCRSYDGSSLPRFLQSHEWLQGVKHSDKRSQSMGASLLPNES